MTVRFGNYRLVAYREFHWDSILASIRFFNHLEQSLVSCSRARFWGYRHTLRPFTSPISIVCLLLFRLTLWLDHALHRWLYYHGTHCFVPDYRRIRSLVSIYITEFYTWLILHCQVSVVPASDWDLCTCCVGYLVDRWEPEMKHAFHLLMISKLSRPFLCKWFCLVLVIRIYEGSISFCSDLIGHIECFPLGNQQTASNKGTSEWFSSICSTTNSPVLN